VSWLSRNNFTAAPSDALHYSFLNKLADDIRSWGGNVNAGGYELNNLSRVSFGATFNAQNLALYESGANFYGFGFETGVYGAAMKHIAGTTGGHSFYVDSTIRAMFIHPEGRVGIGTIAPGQRVTVYGTTSLPQTSGTSQTGLLRVESTASNCIDMGLSSVSPFGAWIQATNVLALGTNYPLILNPNGGNVGIGKVNPGSALSVAGLVEYANEAAAILAGLTTDDLYLTGTYVRAVS
jgi:hypothetical protein